MTNPLKLPWLMLRAKRPSRIGEMRAIEGGFWLGRSYEAMMFFGWIVAHTQAEADRLNATTSANSISRRHETIHLRQAQSCHNSWLCYYTLYLWFYLRMLPFSRRRRRRAYLLNPFEMEAYAFMHSPTYLADHCTRRGAVRWRVYARMKPGERHLA